ncbi:unnamed protein product, partial [Laminaria digitata]
MCVPLLTVRHLVNAVITTASEVINASDGERVRTASSLDNMPPRPWPWRIPHGKMLTPLCAKVWNLRILCTDKKPARAAQPQNLTRWTQHHNVTACSTIRYLFMCAFLALRYKCFYCSLPA